MPRTPLLSIPAAGFRVSARMALLIVCFALPVSALAQTPPADLPSDASDVTLELNTQGRGLYQLALPEPEEASTLSSAERAGAETLDETLRRDLELSRVFDIQGPEQLSILSLTGDRTRDFELYRSLGNELVVLGKVRTEGSKLVYEGRLYDLTAGQAILGKRYRGAPDAMRRIAHIFSDEVIAYLAGRKGIAQTTIAFTSDRTGQKEIFLTDYDGYNQRQLTGHKSTSMSPDWAPGNGSLVYTSFVGGNPGIYRADISTGKKTPAITEGSQNISASFSPDGRRLTFSRALGANSEIFISNLSGGGLQQLTHSRAIDTNPAWSPKGTEIAFTSSRAGNPNVYVMDVEGTNVRRVSIDGNYSDGATWSPSGDKLAFASRIRGRFEIVVTDAVTRESRVLTRGGGNNEAPTFSPDGQWIAFSSTRSGSKQIWVMNAETGGDMRQLTREGNNESPSWSGYPPKK